MSKVIDVSGKLGEYMLRGWVLTDKPCSTSGCNVPLMRSPTGQTPITHFCANCNGDPTGTSSSPDAPSASAAPSSPSASSVHYSRSSTPPTELSSGLSSPTFAPPVETAESRRRREQSDRASAEIGKRLLQGWAMLADECPNPRCFGVPLVRAPTKPGGVKNPAKHCIICERSYVDERDAAGWERLVSVESSGSQTVTASPLVGPSSSVSTQKGKNVVRNRNISDSEELPLPAKKSKSSALLSREAAIRHPPELVLDQVDLSGLHRPQTNTLQALRSESASSLERALRILGQRLNTLTEASHVLDVSAIGTTADAMKRVSDALKAVQSL